ncbi:Glu/Leu/Phe/Val dehydrogenase dimerization domain-containing protein [Paenibacillus sp. RC67]|uniref:Leu/Phe/Val dehydrogenase n=1 Tax=Paenibacillus sp. RC67 TaxID=3039392 RepID=UPI0024AD894A|nr:Glu/Leu/Phe/Val dehydrogenase dimerization domain-containing protein [Paenibacillus sp. RC67]
MELWKAMELDNAEQLVLCQDRNSGLKVVIAIHSTSLGPALGGCRMWDYATEEDAIRDALRLAKGMTYKCAVSGLSYGGGKAVVMGRPDSFRRKDVFRALGRFIETLRGRYVTGIDLGTTVQDMDVVRLETGYVTDTTGSLCATGDFTAEMTAYGVFLGMNQSLMQDNGSNTMANITVAVQGLGKVGSFLCRYLHGAGARLIVTDVDDQRVRNAVQQYGAAAVHPDHIYACACDIFAPCALGAILNDSTIPQLQCRIIAGAANNQLAEEKHGIMLNDAGILYAPDYVINAGGIIVTAAELNGYDESIARRQVERISATLSTVYQASLSEGIATSAAADKLAEQRLSRVLP